MAFSGFTQEEARQNIARHIALVSFTREQFEKDGGPQDGTNVLYVLLQHKLAGEMRMRREYFDAFGVPYDGVEA